MLYNFTFTTEAQASGRKVVFATVNNSTESRFVVGRRTSYLGDSGLINSEINPGAVFSPEEYFSEHGFWAYFLHPTAQAESGGSFNCLNTYDKAKFTFGFMQFAAHVPDGDFVKLFKNLLVLPNAVEYFPKLRLKDGRIFYTKTDTIWNQLENSTSTKDLMDYLNPTLAEIETQELICAARLVHWAMNDPKHQQVQVNTAIEHMKNNLLSYHNRFGLHGVPAKVCLMVCDIRHQGRGTNAVISAALKTSGNFERAFENLCAIGRIKYPQRINMLRNTIATLQRSGIFNKKYDSVSNSFVDL